MATKAALCVLALLSFASGRRWPDGFIWGASTASYQIEGAWDEDGRGPSIWDTWSKIPGNVYNGQSGDTACDHYHKYEEDLALMSQLGIDSYRFSISWSRILPTGRLPINPAGVQFYDNVLNGLLERGIMPFVTLYHWDLPEALQNEYGGWAGNETQMVEDFVEYARVCFELFGDRVKYWLTFNEPKVFVQLGYEDGSHAPGIVSPTNIFAASRTVILCHAEAVRLYRESFQDSQGGSIGITLNSNWREPLNDDPANILACERAMHDQVAWWYDPLFYGDYSPLLYDMYGDLLPPWSPEEQELIRGSSDFFGLNHYTTRYCTNDPECTIGSCHLEQTEDENGVPIGIEDISGRHMVPWGLRAYLNWVDNRYPNEPIYITENGYPQDGDPDITYSESLNDTMRIVYYEQYIESVNLAINEDGVDVKSYYAWSLLDNFEWTFGYSQRFGLYYIDFAEHGGDFRRFPKSSVSYYAGMIADAKRESKGY